MLIFPLFHRHIVFTDFILLQFDEFRGHKSKQVFIISFFLFNFRFSNKESEDAKERTRKKKKENKSIKALGY